MFLFYAAVHHVESALAATQGAHSLNHGERFRNIERMWPSQRDAKTRYRYLYNLSRRCRYECYVPSERELVEALRCLTAVTKELV